MNFIGLTTDRLLLSRVDIYQGKCSCRPAIRLVVSIYLPTHLPWLVFTSHSFTV